MSSGEPTPRELLAVAVAAAEEAGRQALKWFGARPAVEVKADGSPVTVADREAEGVLRELIRASFPEHSVLGEEGGLTEGPAPYRWIIDPIDGTKSFIAGVPLWSVLVGVEARTEPVVGVICLPALGETVAASRGGGCTLDGAPCRVSQVSALSQSLLVASSARATRRRPGYAKLADGARIERTWGDGYGYALVASGRAEIMVDLGVAVWDLAPMLTIIEEAGGLFTDWRGRRTTHAGEAVATNGLLHADVLSILGGSDENL